MGQIAALIDHALVVSAFAGIICFLLAFFLIFEKKTPLYKRAIVSFLTALLIFIVSMFLVVNSVAYI